MVGNQLEDTEQEDMQPVDNLELDSQEPEVDKAVHMLLVHSQLQEELVDQCVTSAEKGVLPLVVDQTCHLVCPFQPYAVSVTNKMLRDGSK